MRNYRAQYHASPLYYQQRPGPMMGSAGPMRSAMPPSFTHPPQQPPRRRLEPWMVIAIVIAVILMIAGVISFMVQQYAPPGNGGNTATTGTPLPTPTPTLTEHQKYQQMAAEYVSKMSLEDMIGQLLFVTDDPTITGDVDLDYMVSTQHIGGILVDWKRINGVQQVQTDIAHWMQEAPIPLFVATEDEGGYVRRLADVYPEFKPLSAAAIGKSGDPNVAVTQATEMAQHLKELTFNTTFTPVSEVAVLPNGYLDYNDRCFGNTPEKVIEYVGPYLSTMQQEGIIATLKHFPGTGRVDQADDPHYVLPTLPDVSKTEYYDIDMAPFKHFIQSQNTLEHPGFIMTTYVLIPSIDPDFPAQYSSKFIDGILRQEFGYDGVVITDSLTVMQGNQINGQMLTLDQAVVAALKAGDDMMLGVTSSDQVDLIISSIKDAIQQGGLTQDRIKQSATRVITLKLERKLMTTDMLQ